LVDEIILYYDARSKKYETTGDNTNHSGLIYKMKRYAMNKTLNTSNNKFAWRNCKKKNTREPGNYTSECTTGYRPRITLEEDEKGKIL